MRKIFQALEYRLYAFLARRQWRNHRRYFACFDPVHETYQTRKADHPSKGWRAEDYYRTAENPFMVERISKYGTTYDDVIEAF